MSIAIVAESFLPHMHGVTGSVLQIARHLRLRGIDGVIIAPNAAGMPASVDGTPVVGVPSIAVPGYRSLRVGTASVAAMTEILADAGAHTVHLASPFALGWRAVVAAERLDIPSVAVYQTDVAAYAERYRVSATTTLAERHITRLHRRATLTLAPSSDAERRLRTLGVDRLRRWGRGVDSGRFRPGNRDEAWRQRIAGNDVIVGYVGRLAPEKQVADLAVLCATPGLRVVIIGDGPSRTQLEAALPGAVFLGHRSGDELAAIVASFDVFVHPGESETFGQTLQEAHASGVPVVATGSGGPLDLVRSSVDGWLYRPGDLADLQGRVLDLAGDERKRAAFGLAGQAAVAGRTWEAVCDDLLEHHREAARMHGVDRAARVRRARRAEPVPVSHPVRVRRYVALGDSLTEGLCDVGRDGELRGWADRLAEHLAAGGSLHYANLAVRSRRVADVVGAQADAAIALRPDLVSILIGANDLVRAHADVTALAAAVERTVRRLRDHGSDVLLVTPFLPEHRVAQLFARRFARFASLLAGVAERTGARLVDTDLHPELAERRYWGEDLVHLGRSGHRLLAYRAAHVLGMPNAAALGALDDALHIDHDEIQAERGWWRRHALPWMWRRMRGRVAGDGRAAKHDRYVLIGGTASTSVDA